MAKYGMSLVTLVSRTWTGTGRSPGDQRSRQTCSSIRSRTCHDRVRPARDSGGRPHPRGRQGRQPRVTPCSSSTASAPGSRRSAPSSRPSTPTSRSSARTRPGWEARLPRGGPTRCQPSRELCSGSWTSWNSRRSTSSASHGAASWPSRWAAPAVRAAAAHPGRKRSGWRHGPGAAQGPDQDGDSSALPGPGVLPSHRPGGSARHDPAVSALALHSPTGTGPGRGCVHQLAAITGWTSAASSRRSNSRR